MVARTSTPIFSKSTVVVALAEDLGSASCEQLQVECNDLQHGILSGAIRNLVIDCSDSKCLGGAALGLLLRLWKTTQRHGGSFCMCGLSPLSLEMLRVVKLDRLWPIHRSLLEATADLGG